MKNFLLLLTLLFSLAVTSAAQNLPNYPVTVTATKATLTNADTSIATGPLVRPFHKSFLFTVSITKLTGTLAGSSIFEGSADGAVYFPITTTVLNNGPNELQYTQIGTAFNKYRIRVVSTGTSTASVANTKYLYKL